MYRKYLIQNRRTFTEWRESETELDFKRNRKRLTKVVRRRAHDAVAFLKGIGWLKRRRIECERVETFTAELERLERFIMENHHELIMRYGIRDTVVLMGPKQFYGLANCMMSQPYRFALADFSGNGRWSRLHGLHVVVLPWMEGTVLVPKEYMPIEQKLVPSGVMVTDEARRRLEDEAEGLRAAGLWNRFMGRVDDQP